MTENISCTGVLFQADQAAEPNTPVAVRFVLPPQIAGENAVEVTCNGYVVRRSAMHSAPEKYAVAIAILDYRLNYDQQRQEAHFRELILERPASKSMFASLVHQFNSQLAVIVGNCDLILSHSAADDALKRSVESIKNAGLKAASLVREFIAKGN